MSAVTPIADITRHHCQSTLPICRLICLTVTARRYLCLDLKAWVASGKIRGHLMSYREDGNNRPVGKPDRRGDASDQAQLFVAAKLCLHLADQLDYSIRRRVIPGSPAPQIET